MNKCKLGNNSHIFKLILILTTLPYFAVCLLVKCKNLDVSDQALRIYSRYNMSSF